MALITKNEFILLALLAVLGLVWGGAVNPYLQASGWFQNLDPVSAYLFYNVGTFFLITAIFSVPSIVLIKRDWDINWYELLVGGIVPFIVVSFMIDMMLPPLAWDTTGRLLIPLNSSLENTSVDYMTGWTFMQFGGPQTLVYYFTYGFVPIFVFFIVILVYGQREVMDLAERLF